MGGLFVDCGLFGNGGGGGLDFLPIAASYEGGGVSGCSSFMAAIRARMDIGGAGASSLMIEGLDVYYRRNSDVEQERVLNGSSESRAGQTA